MTTDPVQQYPAFLLAGSFVTYIIAGTILLAHMTAGPKSR